MNPLTKQHGGLNKVKFILAKPFLKWGTSIL